MGDFLNGRLSITKEIKKIQLGDEKLRNELIERYKPFVLKTLSQETGRYIEIENDDAYSVGLFAFNEAIDSFEADKNKNFLKFSALVIKRRLIDHYRTSKKTEVELPFSYFDDEEREKNPRQGIQSISDPYSDKEMERIEIVEQIQIFEKLLKKFKITLNELAQTSPQHDDTRQRCIEIAKAIAETPHMYNRLMESGAFCMTELMEIFIVSQRTIERNKKYIISLCLIMKSDLDVLKEYIDGMCKRRV